MPVGGGGFSGGASAGQIRAGGATYEVQGKDGVSAVLTKIETRVKGFRGFMQRVGTGLFSGGAGILGAGAAGAATAAVKVWEDLAGGIRTYNRELEKSQQLTSELAKAQGRIRDQRRQAIDAIANPQQRAESLQAEIGRLQTELRGSRGQENRARTELDDLARTFSMGNITDRLLGSHEGFVSKAQSDLDTAKSKSGELSDALADARRQLHLLMNPTENFRLTAEIENSVQNLRREISLLRASTADKAARKFEEAGFTPMQLSDLRSQTQLAEQLRNQHSFEEEVKATRERLSDARRLDRGMTQEELEIVKLSQRAAQKGIGFDIAQSGLLQLLPKVKEMTESKVGVGRGSAQRFGAGDTATKQGLTLMQRIAQNTSPDRVAEAVADAMRLR
jgi:hypothetical protein